MPGSRVEAQIKPDARVLQPPHGLPAVAVMSGELGQPVPAGLAGTVPKSAAHHTQSRSRLMSVPAFQAMRGVSCRAALVCSYPALIRREIWHGGLARGGGLRGPGPPVPARAATPSGNCSPMKDVEPRSAALADAPASGRRCSGWPGSGTRHPQARPGGVISQATAYRYLNEAWKCWPPGLCPFARR